MNELSLSIPVQIVGKAEHATRAESLAAVLLDELEIIPAFVACRQIVEIAEGALALMKDRAILEANAAGKQMIGSATIETTKLRRYEYEDSQLDRLSGDAKVIADKVKARKHFLESLTAELVDPATGELVKPAKVTSDGATIKISFGR